VTAELRVGIVGLGWIAANPLGAASDAINGTDIPRSHASALAAIPGVRVVGVCDMAPAPRDGFLATWSERWPGVKAYPDHATLLAEQAIDLLTIATPDHLHTKIVLDAVANGVRGVFCEKPFTTDVAEADAIIAAASSRGTVISVDHTRRWYPEFRLARKLLQDGRCGRISQVFVHNGGERAMLFRNTSHFIDVACFFAEADPTWVVAELEPGFESYGTAYAGDGGRSPARDPGANIYVGFANGVRAWISDWKTDLRDMTFTVVGATGKIGIGPDGLTVTSAGENGAMRVEHVTPRGSVSGIEAALRELVDAVRSGSPVSSSAIEARKTVAILDAVLRSHAAGNVRVTVR
jgi:predicted dehydrogenase